MIGARGLVKHYGSPPPVDNPSFDVRPGRVTGFLGPNGAGKTTTMRMILGLDRPTGGSVTVHGKPFAPVYSAMRCVGRRRRTRLITLDLWKGSMPGCAVTPGSWTGRWRSSCWQVPPTP